MLEKGDVALFVNLALVGTAIALAKRVTSPFYYILG
jgi:hypothetical protein